MAHLSIDLRGISGQWDFYLGSNGNAVRGGLGPATVGGKRLTSKKPGTILKRRGSREVGESLALAGKRSAEELVATYRAGDYRGGQSAASELGKKGAVEILDAAHRRIPIEVFPHAGERAFSQLFSQGFRAD